MISKDFVTAGRAIFTLEVPQEFQSAHKTKPHYTYRVKKVVDKVTKKESFFVLLLTGPDNTSNYSYLGLLDIENGTFRLTRKSKFGDSALSVKFFQRIMFNLWNNTVNNITEKGFDLHHEGRCGRCAKLLTVPESVKTGFGPECSALLGIK